MSLLSHRSLGGIAAGTATIKIVPSNEQLRRKLETLLRNSPAILQENTFMPEALSQAGDARSLILDPIAARLGIGDALLLLITHRDGTEESRTAGFAGK